MEAPPTVTFQPDGRSVTVEAGQTLLDAAAAAGIPLNSVCGGRGICQRCRMHVLSGDLEVEAAGRVDGAVLACLSRVRGDVVVEVPSASRIEGEQILTGAERGIGPFLPIPEEQMALPRAAGLFVPSPLAFALPLDLPVPTLHDSVSDMQRLTRELRRQRNIREVTIPLEVLRALPRVVRQGEWTVTALLARADGGYQLIDLRPGAAPRAFGVAVDVGTTTVVVHLVDLTAGTTLGAAAALNRQIPYGDDVISRIIHAGEPAGLERLRTAALETINLLIGGLAKVHRVGREEIIGAVCAGNTTMLHLLLGLPPAEIRREPYIPAATASLTYRAGEVGLRIHPRALVATMPGVSSYVGGDITADVLAAGMDGSEELSMLIDVGTNGETVIGNREFLVCCACSAGPAFEGGGITWGMRAARGAIQRVEVTPQGTLAWTTIGGARPRGLCGSGLVDLLAELLRAGYLDRGGRLVADAPPVRRGPDGLEVLVVPASQTATGADIVLTAADIENLLRAKAAVFAGAALLARRLGIAMGDIQRVYVAGGFGTYLDVRKAIRIGLLPDVPPERVVFIGNGSVAGAKMTLLSYEVWRRAVEVAQKMTYRELSTDPAFMEEYVSAMFLPHTDCARFPRACAELGMQV
ncbi:MAG: ASKHA domain-containing protein [Armatimonadota bacterium]|nr:ASKHA domain-containing protein [Armatimonadota bacterium]MDR7426597.1 ASKHA domain-containing protein [Armatimonadota bacterium]MDR7463696.1 ASKHA domain-containing protein [Armatimonadota bacterium]MDR7473740.1 ASKHA domain-containing protein [Armatimonadota bacterium]MDR7538123.1 ASKHA domain-containing protein [Armatimonadota bacterium]